MEGAIRSLKDYLRKIDEVSAPDVLRVAKEYVDTKMLSLAVIGNFENPERFEKLLK